jgi:hypothetical protein
MSGLCIEHLMFVPNIGDKIRFNGVRRFPYGYRSPSYSALY